MVWAGKMVQRVKELEAKADSLESYHWSPHGGRELTPKSHPLPSMYAVIGGRVSLPQ